MMSGLMFLTVLIAVAACSQAPDHAEQARSVTVRLPPARRAMPSPAFSFESEAEVVEELPAYQGAAG
jgi:hypothetical protein